MIVVDTSAWVELFRRTGHPVATALKALLAERAELAITEGVLMEVLSGAPTGEGLAEVRSQLVDLPILRLEGVADFEEAAFIYRACRDSGHTLRSQVDCLIAVPTIRHGASLLHNDPYFETIAKHTSLKLEPVDRAAADRREVRERAGPWRARATRARARRSS